MKTFILALTLAALPPPDYKSDPLPEPEQIHVAVGADVRIGSITKPVITIPEFGGRNIFIKPGVKVFADDDVLLIESTANEELVEKYLQMKRDFLVYTILITMLQAFTFVCFFYRKGGRIAQDPKTHQSATSLSQGSD